MSYSDDTVIALTDEQCRARLEQQQLGRLVTHVGDVLDIFPVNYIVDGGGVLFRTAAGSKLCERTDNVEVRGEVDDHTATDAWSVIVRGHAHRLETAEEVAYADGLPLVPWIPTLKYNYVRVEPTHFSGRAFRRGPEPDRYGVIEH